MTSPSDVEDRMGIDPLAVLLAERHRLVEKCAPLRAKYGPGGLWDAARKLRLSQIASAIRGRVVEQGQKVTESWVDETSHASDDYVAFVTDALLERTEWAILEDRIQAIQDQILRGNAIARFLAAEAHL